MYFYDDLGRERLEELRELAEYYAERYCPTGAVDPVVIAQEIGLRYAANDYSNCFDGVLDYRNGAFHVFLHLNEGENLYVPRVRFSFAHELGHYIIDSHRNAIRSGQLQVHGSQGVFWSDAQTEREADYFAACLLLPERRLHNDIFRRKFNASLIDEIRRKYNVSYTAAMLRFVGAGNHPVMVVCSRNGKVKWKRSSEDFPFWRLNTDADGGVPENTAVAEYFEEGKKYQHAEKVFAEDWFVLFSERDRRRPFNEFCVYYDPFNQVISLVWEG